MRPLRYSINVTLDGCCDHREGIADEELHRHAAWNLDQADALLFGRITYEMMEAAWRPQAPTGAWPDWMVHRRIDRGISGQRTPENPDLPAPPHRRVRLDSPAGRGPAGRV